jgi:hypothetical protein
VGVPTNTEILRPAKDAGLRMTGELRRGCGVGDLGTSEAKACFHFSVFYRSAGSAAPPKNLSLNHQNNHQGLCLIRHPLALADKCLHT